MPGGLPPNEGVFGEDENVLHVIGVGDSVIAGVGVGHLSESITARVAEQLAQSSGRSVHWSAYGCNGDRARELIDKIPHVPGKKVDLVLVSIGVNDVSRLTSVVRWQLEITALIAALRERFRAPIVFMGLPPMGEFPVLPHPLRFALGIRAALLDLMLKNAASVIDDVHWADSFSEFDESHIATDGFHPNERACRTGAQQIVGVLKSGGFDPRSLANIHTG